MSFVIQKKRNEIADPETGYAFKFYKMGKWVTFKGLDKKVKFPEMTMDFSRQISSIEYRCYSCRK